MKDKGENMRRKPIDIKRIIEAYNNGENESEIAQIEGIANAEVLTILGEERSKKYAAIQKKQTHKKETLISEER